MISSTIIIGARKSVLSQIQAFEVGAKIKECYPSVELQYHFRESLGDLNQQANLTSFDTRGVFTEDFHRLLVNREIDMAVHSWKDLPTASREDTVIAATLERADSRDVLLLKRSSADTAAERETLTIFSSSPRREYNIGRFLNWALPFNAIPLFEPVRGNIETRLRKLFESSADGLIVAKAALDRLLSPNYPQFEKSRATIREFVDNCLLMVIPLSQSPAAPAQGALAVEVLRDNREIQELLASINDRHSYECIEKEREILSYYGGGCHQKIGASIISKPWGRVKFVKGITDDGEILDSTVCIGRTLTLPKAAEMSAIWPQETDVIDHFIRRDLTVTQPSLKGDQGLWISRAEALPTSWNIDQNVTVWCAGDKSWKRLARRGVWVTGCADGLGEEEDPGLEYLRPDINSWLKLTHEEGYRGAIDDVLSTYKLVQDRPFPKLKGRTHFFWTSGSVFKAALDANPEIAYGWHGCGPGNTYKVVIDHIKSPSRVGQFLSYRDFLEEVAP